jgi:hypothetical protein
MPSLAQLLLSVAVGGLLLRLALLAALSILQRHGPDRMTLLAGLRLLPAVVRLLRRLAGLPR